MEYPLIPGTKQVPYTVLPAISTDGPLPEALTSPELPVAGGKHIFAFWHSGISTMPPYMLRNVLEWHARFSPLGWKIYVLDNVSGSPLNVSNFIDTTSTANVPAAFINGELAGGYVAQHTSDLIRYPTLLKYGGAYMDVGIIQFGDLDHLWSLIADPSSPYGFAGFTMGYAPDISIVNFSFLCGAGNPLVTRAHKILLKLWEGRTHTSGMTREAIVAGTPLMRVPGEVVVDDEGADKMVINDESMTDYAIQIHAMGTAQRWVDPEDGWDGPRYVRENCWLQHFLEASMVGPQMTGWDGQREWELLCLELPKDDKEEETADQKAAREIVEKAVGESWCMKLGHGFSAKLFGGDTLGMIWRKRDGSDCRPGTYAAWMRWAATHLTHETFMDGMKMPVYEPTRVAKLSEFL